MISLIHVPLDDVDQTSFVDRDVLGRVRYAPDDVEHVPEITGPILLRRFQGSLLPERKCQLDNVLSLHTLRFLMILSILRSRHNKVTKADTCTINRLTLLEVVQTAFSAQTTKPLIL